MLDLGVVEPGSTLIVDFNSFGASGEALTLSGLAVTDIELYSDGGTTQRASDNGITLLDTDGIDIDGVTGFHGFSINLADNSDAGFYGCGKSITAELASVTVNSQTVSFIAVKFRIGYRAAILNTTIATLAGQTSFTLTDGPAEDDALNGCWCVIHDVASKVQKAIGIILDYTGATKTVTLAAAPTFTIAATDNFSVMGPMPLQPTVQGRTLDVSTGGEGGVDWANVGSPTTTLNLSGTTVKTATDVEADTQDIQSRLPAALGANGNLKADVRDFNGVAATSSGGRPEVNASHWAGAATATDDLALVTAPANFAALGINASGHISRVTLVDTATDLTNKGTGSGYTAIPWNAAWDAEVQSEVQDAIEVNKLDHLVAVADADDAVDNSIIAKLASKGATADWSSFVNTTDALEALRDNMGTAQTADNNTKLTVIQKLLEADLQIDTSTTPWALVFLENGTGAIGVGTELLRQPLRDVSGTAIGNTTTVIGRAGL